MLDARSLCSNLNQTWLIILYFLFKKSFKKNLKGMQCIHEVYAIGLHQFMNFSVPDHLGIRETRGKRFGAVGQPLLICDLRLLTLACRLSTGLFKLSAILIPCFYTALYHRSLKHIFRSKKIPPKYTIVVTATKNEICIVSLCWCVTSSFRAGTSRSIQNHSNRSLSPSQANSLKYAKFWPMAASNHL